MDRSELLKGKNVTIYFDDGSSVTRKDGIAVDFTESGVVFREGSNRLQFIPFARIIRILEKSSYGGD